MTELKDKFSIGLFLIIASITLSLFSFISEENKITGYAVNELSNDVEVPVFKDINSLSTLSPGEYFIDANGVVNIEVDSLYFPIGKIMHLDESQKNVPIYIDKEGRIGYVLDIIENG